MTAPRTPPPGPRPPRNETHTGTIAHGAEDGALAPLRAVRGPLEAAVHAELAAAAQAEADGWHEGAAQHRTTAARLSAALARLAAAEAKIAGTRHTMIVHAPAKHAR